MVCIVLLSRLLEEGYMALLPLTYRLSPLPPAFILRRKVGWLHSGPFVPSLSPEPRREQLVYPNQLLSTLQGCCMCSVRAALPLKNEISCRWMSLVYRIMHG